MPYYNPLQELIEIQQRVKAGRLPQKAEDFARKAFATAQGILEVIEDMESKNLDAPTAAQSTALLNIYRGACRWLHISPVLPTAPQVRVNPAVDTYRDWQN